MAPAPPHKYRIEPICDYDCYSTDEDRIFELIGGSEDDSGGI